MDTLTSDEIAAVLLLRKYKNIGTPTALAAMGVITTFELSQNAGAVQHPQRFAS